MVQIKRKVTIKKKISQEEKPILNGNHDEGTVQTSLPKEKSKSNKIIGGVILAAVIVAGIYFFGLKEDSTAVNEDANPVEQVATTDNTSKNQEIDIVEGGDRQDNIHHEDVDVPVEADQTTADASKVTGIQSAEKQQRESVSPSQVPTSSLSAISSQGSIEGKAKQVIRGEFGNGQERKNKLGTAYNEVQSKVNEMYRSGLIK